MVKLSKCYLLMACLILCLSGCAKNNAEVADSTQNHIETTIYHPIEKDGIDYLSVKGIDLGAGTEIAMIATNSQNSFWDVVKMGAQKAVEDFNKELGFSGKDKVSLTFTSPKNEDVIDQINIIDQFLDKAPDALCIAFTDASACKTQMQMAKNNGIKLIAFDTPDDSYMTEALVGTNNRQAATDAAENLFKTIGYEGKVAVIVHNSLTKTGQERKQAIVDVLANSYNDKDIQFVDIVYLAQEERSNQEILDKLLTRTPDLAGIICTDLMTTEMVIDYVAGMKERSFVVSGFDTSEKIVNAVADGTIIGTMAQDPYGIGYAAVTMAARVITESEKAENVYSAHQWIDSENLMTEEVQSLLYD